MNRFTTSALALATALLSTTPTVAQEQQTRAQADEPNGDAIIVTARRKDETLLEVPVAVSALSSADIQRYAATDLTKIGQMVPQVVIAKTGAGGSGASFTIRGIGSSPGDSGIEQSVSVNIDGLLVSRGRLATQGFFDVRQVEVLKGPQALFFGKNSPAGVISLTTNGATKALEGFVRAGYEFKADERYAEAAISGPLTNTLGFRVAGRASKMTGYLHNKAQEFTSPDDPTSPRPGAGDSRSPGQREYLGRVTLEWNPTPEFSAVGKLFVSSYKDNGETGGTEVKCSGEHPITSALVSGQSVVDPYGDCKLDGNRSSTALPADRAAAYPGSRNGQPYTDYSSVLASLKMGYNFGAFRLDSITGFYRYNSRQFDNFDYSSLGEVWGANNDKSSGVTQELRATTDFDGMLNFVVGAFYERGRRTTLGNGMLLNVGADPDTGNYNNWSLVSRNRSNTWSGFGQATLAFAPGWELAGGVRYTRETKHILIGNTYVNANFPSGPGGFVLPAGTFYDLDFQDDNWSPEATLTWHPTPQTTLYGAYKTGYKSGGFSNPTILSDIAADSLRFGSEKARGGEIGAKGSFLNGRLSANLALYRYTFDNLQLTSFNSQTVSFTIRNAASARTTGVELDTSYEVTPDLKLRGAVAYNRARYLNFEGAPCYATQSTAEGCVNSQQDLSGTALVRAPDWNLSGGVTYDTDVTADYRIGLSLDARYTSGYWMQENENPIGRQKAFALLNAQVRFYQADDNWELSLIGRNLTNKYYGVHSVDRPLAVGDDIIVAVGRPREIALQATAHF